MADDFADEILREAGIHDFRTTVINDVRRAITLTRVRTKREDAEACEQYQNECNEEESGRHARAAVGFVKHRLNRQADALERQMREDGK